VASKVDFNIWDNVTYKSNLIKAEVYYEEFNFEDISQSPAYEVSRKLQVCNSRMSRNVVELNGSIPYHNVSHSR
jgi:hypothetical protein